MSCNGAYTFQGVLPEKLGGCEVNPLPKTFQICYYPYTIYDLTNNSIPSGGSRGGTRGAAPSPSPYFE